MSTHEPTEENAKQKSEKEFLTLADKKPSLTRLSGNESMSARTVSTRELSDNLQRTRDGMINLMRKKQLYADGLGRERISEGDDEENFDMLIRRKRQSKDSTRTRGVDGSFDDVAKAKRTLHQLEDFDSEEFANKGDPNSQSNLLNPKFQYGGGSTEGMFKAKNSQKHYLGSDMSSNGFSKRFGKIFDDNDKRFTSQNPKKDGPLSARIFIDAFFPSLEGNRIFPVFNYRCAEKIQRANNNFTERNRKRLNNQLAPVSSSTTMQEVEDDSRETSIEQQKEDLQKGEKILKVKEYQNKEVHKKGDESQRTEAIRDPNKVEEMEQQGKDDKKQKLHQNVESKEVVRKHDVQQAEELHKVKEVEETLVSETNCDRRNRTNVVDHSMVDNEEKQYETAERAQQTLSQNQSKREEPSAAEEELLQKVLRTLMVNEELIDFFCEKVIAKIAARNDFCGPNCKGICGGLNDPQKAN
ncbi:uncharacterized protein LOC119083148 [Bradysia coprophila]|uniref:uncharacterized protein LOC119083148 n=1 Tax=Bradysia coprophila TaxID=38358 RepID=UPI00187D8574|nr:uncharacterized protein LOC119083148 [Bradysia coprophila]